MEEGVVVEEGSIIDIFSRPQTKISKEFVAHTMGYENFEKILNQGFIKDSNRYELTVRISFVGQIAGQAFISKISIEYGIYANILFGSIESLQGVPFGSLIVSFTGNSNKIQEAIGYLEENNVKVEVLKAYGADKTDNAQCS